MVKTAEEIRRINTVDLRSLHLTLTEDSDIEDLTEAVEELRSVKRLVISCAEEDEPGWGNGALVDLFLALGSIPTLQMLKLKHVGYEDDNPFPITLLTYLLLGNHNESIQTIHIQDSGLQDSGLLNNHHEGQQQEGFREFADFAEKLKACYRLRRFKVEGCSISDDPTDSCLAMSYIVDALSFLPQLTDVALEVEEEEGELGILEGSALQHLCQSGTLQSLRLEGFELNYDCLYSIAYSLRHHSNLKKLSMDLYGNDKLGCSALAESLQVNDTLEHIRFEAAFDFNVPGFLFEVAEALTLNHSIQEAAFYGFDEIYNEGERAFATLLETNDVLQSLVLSANSEGRFAGAHRPKIDFYLRLNKRGRRHLAGDFESISRQDWVKVIADCSLDLDCLFFFLHMNPLLCSVPETKKTSSSADGKQNIQTDLSSAARKEDLKQVRKQLKQLKIEYLKGHKTIKGQQKSLAASVERYNERVTTMRCNYHEQLAEKEGEIRFLKEEVTDLRSRMTRLEQLMARSGTTGSSVPPGSQILIPEIAQSNKVYHFNSHLPMPLRQFWSFDDQRKELSLKRMFDIAGSSTVGALDILGLDRKCCGQFFIKGECTKRNCRKMHSWTRKHSTTSQACEVEALLVETLVRLGVA